MDPIYDIVRFLKNLKYEDLPAQVVELIRQDFLDYCGNTLAGSSDPTVAKAFDMYRDWGGKEEVSVYLHDCRLPAVHAALLNSTMGFAMDYDDTHMDGGHIGVTTFPAALAIGEMMGNVSGKDLITAVAGGMEVIVRLGVYNKRRVPRHIFGGWDYQALHSSFSSAATAGMLLKLSEREFLDAFGLAYHQTAGTGLSALEHADTKMLGPGFGLRAGLTSVFMAQRGITGAHNVLEGDYGLGLMYHNGCDVENIAKDLGTKWKLLDTGFKPFASCRLGHRTLDAVRRLIKEHGITANEVTRVDISGSERVVEQLYEPSSLTKNPDVRTAAVFSLPWVVSCMLIYGKVGVAQLNDEALNNEKIRTLAQKVFAEVDTTVDPADHAAALPVTIHTTRGDFTTLINPIAPGDNGNRMTQEELEEKYWDNAQYCVKDIGDEKKKAILDVCNDLEQVEDVRRIVKLLA